MSTKQERGEDEDEDEDGNEEDSCIGVLMRRDNSRATRTRLSENSTRARARLEMLTSRVKQLVTRLEKLARNSNIFVYKILKVFF